MTTGATNSNAARPLFREWCSLWCSAIKYFNVNADNSRTTSYNTVTANDGHQRIIHQQNDNHFIRIDLPRKYRDKNCKITYEL